MGKTRSWYFFVLAAILFAPYSFFTDAIGHTPKGEISVDVPKEVELPAQPAGGDTKFNAVVSGLDTTVPVEFMCSVIAGAGGVGCSAPSGKLAPGGTVVLVPIDVTFSPTAGDEFEIQVKATQAGIARTGNTKFKRVTKMKASKTILVQVPKARPANPPGQPGNDSYNATTTGLDTKAGAPIVSFTCWSLDTGVTCIVGDIQGKAGGGTVTRQVLVNYLDTTPTVFTVTYTAQQGKESGSGVTTFTRTGS